MIGVPLDFRRQVGPMAESVLVTGVLGCLGAWVARCVLDDGDAVIGYDLGDAQHRLDLILGEDAARIELVKGDITELEMLERAIDEHAVTRVIHLAALQVPFVRANPPLGMHVNVAGTVNVFEAVSRRLDRIPNVVYASSTAVYNPTDPSPAPESGGTGRERSTASRSSRTRGWRASTTTSSASRRSPAAVRRLRPGPRSGDDVGPDGRDARGGARRAVPHRVLRHGAVRLRPRRGPGARRRGAFRRQGAAVYNVPGAIAEWPRWWPHPGVVPGAEITSTARRCRFRPCSRPSASTATSARSRGRRSPRDRGDDRPLPRSPGS